MESTYIHKLFIFLITLAEIASTTNPSSLVHYDQRDDIWSIQ